jgi:CRP/FNR family transcriptional regulator, cyclic AMP receptor protein
VRGIVPDEQTPAAHDAPPSPGAAFEEPDLLRAARRLAEGVLDVPAGPWEPVAAPVPEHRAFAAILVDGLMLREVHLGEIPAGGLVVAGDVLDPFGARDDRITWSALEDSTVAVLGPRFLEATRRLPAITVALHRRHAEQGARAARHAAVAQLPRVEQRVLGLLWGLAEERGRVGVDGVTVDLPLTHAGIGRLIGAKRPTVSLALKALAAEGLVEGRRGCWLISRRAAVLSGLADDGALAA